MKKILITGGNGFIGSNFLHTYLNNYNDHILNVDKKSSNQYLFSKFSRYKFIKIDLLNFDKLKNILESFLPEVIIHFAADSHVDNSINYPEKIYKNNTISTLNLLNSVLFSKVNLNTFKFIYVSTDEVYGSSKNKSFKETNILKPSSPYSSSKSSAEHLIQSYFHTYGLNYIITNCSNNFGPFQYPEKLIPLSIFKLINKQKVPVYGNGKQVRDWIFVDDHNDAIIFLLKNGKLNNKYNIGSNTTMTNLSLLKKIVGILEKKDLIKKNMNHFQFVKDRPGHDFRYSLNTKKINDLGWRSHSNFQEKLAYTIEWYLNNKTWLIKNIKNFNNGKRIGLFIKK